VGVEAYKLAVAEGYSDNAGASEWNTLAVVAVHVACASMALTEDAAVDDAALGVGGDAMAAGCVALEGENTVRVAYKAHHGCEAAPA
jgi:hypothetical protein